MNILLTAYNINPDAVIRIYRHYSPFEITDLPPILVELPGDTESYSDDTVALNVMAYYRISVFYRDTEVIGPMYPTMKRYYTGPLINDFGPDQILRGDNFIGRYGTMPLDNVLSVDVASSLIPSCTILPGVDINAIEVEKCSYNGNILFISTLPVFHGSPEDLYNDGALLPYGDGYGAFSSAFYSTIGNKVQQGNPITYKNHSFKFRLMTLDEYSNLYVKLYPDTNAGSMSDRVISNCNPHSFKSPVFQMGSQTGNFRVVGLDGTEEIANWSTKGPLHMVVELLNRGDIGWPGGDAISRPGDNTLDARMDGMVVTLGERLHFFGGVTYYNMFGSTKMNRTHVSYNVDGGDMRVHADMPTPVIRGCAWTDGQKIYCFGGASEMGGSAGSLRTTYQDIQVWEDDGTGVGSWTTMQSNIPYYFGAQLTVYYDNETDRQRILYLGGFDDYSPDPKRNFATADLLTFDGTFTIYTNARFNNYCGGGAVAQYGDSFIMAGVAKSPQNFTTYTYKFKIPTSLTAAIQPTLIGQQETELVNTNGYKMHVYKDTLFLLTSMSIDREPDKLYIYQFVRSENRWLQIEYNAAGTNTLDMGGIIGGFYNDKCLASITYRSNNPVPNFYTLKLTDPLDAPILPITDTAIGTSRMYVTHMGES